MTLYTRRGDSGETSLADGTRVRKDDVRVEAYGTLDEAIAQIGSARSAAVDPMVGDVLTYLQHKTMLVAAVLAGMDVSGPDATTITDTDVEALERCIDALEARVDRTWGFVVEGSCERSVRLDVARTVMRRAERRLAALGTVTSVDGAVAAFVNRASDLLYACAAIERMECVAGSEPWDPSMPPPL